MTNIEQNRNRLTSTKGILQAESAAQHYTLTRYPPSERLASYIEYEWIVRWDLPAGQIYVAEILPFPNVSISITAEESVITGVVTSKFTYDLTGSGVVVGVKFRPGGFYPFYKKPIERLTNQKLPLKTVFAASRIKKIIEQLPSASDHVLIAETEKLLLARHPEQDDTITAIDDIITTIQTNRDIQQVQMVCDMYEVSERTVQHAFKQYVGVGLKWAITRYRLQDAAAAIDGGRTDWATLAQECGFADQPHFIRDFKKVLGETPAQYAKRIQKSS